MGINPFLRGVIRRALTQLPALSPDLVLVIQGGRRCGKSTLLQQIMEHFDLNPEDCVFVNFEDPRLSDHLDFNLLDRIIAFASGKNKEATRRYFFFDEIQNVRGWEKWLHLKVERPGQACFVITGSNAALLSGDLGSRLTGRHRTIELFPFDLGEFREACPARSFLDYLQLGGFPRALIDAEPMSLLREYFTDIIERDVRRHVSARSSLSLFQLVKAVFESLGSELSQRALAGLLGVSVDTIGTYLDACAASYLILPCPFFTFSERQRTGRHRKYYPIDLGLRNAVVTKTGQDRGKALETVVFHHLRKKSREVFYWRQQGEIDFVTMDEQGITPYQVTWDENKVRHEKSIREFYQAFPQSNPVVEVSADNVESFLRY